MTFLHVCGGGKQLRFRPIIWRQTVVEEVMVQCELEAVPVEKIQGGESTLPDLFVSGCVGAISAGTKVLRDGS